MRDRSPAVRIVFNPTRGELPLGPPALWRQHRRNAPSIVLQRSRRPTISPRFVVPDVPAGTYLIATFDGSEGGHHYTWDSFRVVKAPARGDGNREAYHLIFWLTIAGGALLIGDVLVQLRGRARRAPTARL